MRCFYWIWLVIFYDPLKGCLGRLLTRLGNRRWKTTGERPIRLVIRKKNCGFFSRKRSVLINDGPGGPRELPASPDPLLHTHRARKTPADKSFTRLLRFSRGRVNCARALHFHEILAGCYCHLRVFSPSLSLSLARLIFWQICGCSWRWGRLVLDAWGIRRLASSWGQ